MKLLTSFLLLISVSFSAISVENTQAKLLLEQLSNSLRQLNFSTSFVVVKNNQAEPYHWIHGVSKENIELEILALLNGPRRDILRKGNTVSYIEPKSPAYSVTSNYLSSPIPSILSGNISNLEENYHFVSVGRSRILGRAAQLVRIVAKDTHRFDYWLWLDQTTGLLLKLAVITRQGQLLEQIQFTHLEVSDTLSENLLNLQSAELPKVMDMKSVEQLTDLSWKVNWLPHGFKKVNANRHQVNNNKKSVEFILFNDGLVNISVSIGNSKERQRAMEYANDGATLVLNEVKNNIEISVVGKIPPETARQILTSITFINKPKP